MEKKKETKSNLVQKKPAAIQQSAPSAMIQLAISNNVDLEKLEKVLELQLRWEANEARKAYHLAMAAFKVNAPMIDKDRHVSYATQKGKTEYDHASLFNVTKKINSELSKHGLSSAWSISQTPQLITITCTITHEKGHSESTPMSGPPDTSGSKNPIQAIASTSSYLERYTLLALTGLATYDQDNDARPEKKENEEISDPQPIKQPVSNDSQQSQDKPGAMKPDPGEPIAAKDPKAVKTNPKPKSVGLAERFEAAKKSIGDQHFAQVLKNCGYTRLNGIKTVAKAEEVLKELEEAARFGEAMGEAGIEGESELNIEKPKHPDSKAI